MPGNCLLAKARSWSSVQGRCICRATQNLKMCYFARLMSWAVDSSAAWWWHWSRLSQRNCKVISSLSCGLQLLSVFVASESSAVCGSHRFAADLVRTVTCCRVLTAIATCRRRRSITTSTLVSSIHHRYLALQRDDRTHKNNADAVLDLGQGRRGSCPEAHTI